MGSKIRRITIIESAADGSVQSVASQSRKRKKRKTSRWTKGAERNARTGIKSMRVFAEQLEKRHNKSSRKKKDGWARDWQKNTLKANTKALKKLRKLRAF